MLILTRSQNESIIINGIAVPKSTRRRASAGSVLRKKRGQLDGELHITKQKRRSVAGPGTGDSLNFFFSLTESDQSNQSCAK
jgi:hypothetical protein